MEPSYHHAALFAAGLVSQSLLQLPIEWNVLIIVAAMSLQLWRHTPTKTTTLSAVQTDTTKQPTASVPPIIDAPTTTPALSINASLGSPHPTPERQPIISVATPTETPAQSSPRHKKYKTRNRKAATERKKEATRQQRETENSLAQLQRSATAEQAQVLLQDWNEFHIREDMIIQMPFYHPSKLRRVRYRILLLVHFFITTCLICVMAGLNRRYKRVQDVLARSGC
jgi:hypothetical protein